MFFSRRKHVLFWSGSRKLIGFNKETETLVVVRKYVLSLYFEENDLFYLGNRDSSFKEIRVSEDRDTKEGFETSVMK